MFSRLIAAILCFVCLPVLTLAAQKPDKKGVEFFEKKIRPVLVEHCYSCHSAKAKKVKGELLVDTRDSIRRGGESGDAVIPYDVENSLLIQAIKHETNEMPPDEMLSKETIADFVSWIKMGAPDPRDGKSKLIKREINFDKARKFWAFVPPQNPDVPQVKNTAWPRNEIDNFVLAELEKKNLQPVSDSDRTAIARRIYFDIIGLPPSPREIVEFVNDQSSDAVSKLVKKLMELPQYGERWGRHWLDVARFAESNGRERNFLYPHAWRYRNYVFDSIAKDKPYDQFVKEQIAGDLLGKDAGNEELRKEMLIATGFLAIGPKTLNEQNKEKFRMDVVDEQIDVSTRAVMSLTVSCARCNDHKFDPLPTSEYYSLAGIFRSSTTLYGTRGGGNRHPSSLLALDKKTAAQQQAAANAKKVVKKPQNANQLNQKIKVAQRKLRALRNTLKQLDKQKKNGKPVAASAYAKAKTDVAKAQKQVRTLNAQRKRRGNGPPIPVGNVAMGISEGNVGDAFVLVRGEVTGRNGQVPRGFLTILSEKERLKVKSKESGRRELAQWLTSPENPLTARVIVNRIWHHLFGEGLVRTVDNFGATGEKPTHPELLDFLALRFVKNGWSIKETIQYITSSRTYQLSSKVNEANYEIDPENRLLWRFSPRRLDAESIRDAMLASSGKLSLKRPEKSFVAQYRDSQAIGRGVDTQIAGTKTNVRSVYLPVVRNAVHESLKVFDFAEPSIIVGKRENTTVPAQSLYLLNNPFVIEQSEALAERILSNKEKNQQQRIELAYQIALGRNPILAESARAKKFIDQFRKKMQEDNPNKVAWAAFCQSIFASAEFRYVY